MKPIPTVAAVIGAAVLALLAPACSSGSPSSAGSADSSAAPVSASTPSAVAYSHCMRSHGVPNFPDPGSNGVVPKADLPQLGVSSSQLQAAQRDCQALYPTSGGSFEQRAQQCYVAGDCPPAIVQQVLTQLRKFARCMRSHGVQNWPDPVADSQGHVYFNISAQGITRHSPQIDSKTHECEHVMNPDVPWGSSDTVTGVGQQAEVLAAAEAEVPGRRRRGGWAAAGLVVVLAAGALSAWRAGAFSAAGSSFAGQGAQPPATQAVVRQDLSATTPVTATLGYAGSYTVIGQGGGTLTSLPPAGRVIRQGQVLYRVDNGSPVVLLYGGVPAWRTLAEGLTGQDVSQLNHDLVRLGYADRADTAALGWDYYSWQTAYAVQQLEDHLGVSPFPLGTLSLGQVVFKPEALRVSQVTGNLGGPADGPVLTATSDRHVVTIALDTSQESEVRAGDTVSITLPDGTTTPGVVSSVGTVATTAPASGQGQNPTTTIPVQVRLSDPGAAGTLDQAPVTVNITTDSVKNALAVPVSALLAQSRGGYEVEVVGPGNTRRYVTVTVGIFDDADEMVQVTGALTPGQRVVTAPAS